MSDATDKVIYRQADGTETVFVPRDQRWPVVNRPAVKVMVVRPDAAADAPPGEWVLPSDPGIVRPPSPTPAGPTDGPLLKPGESWADALRQAKSGTTVYLMAGETYVGPGLVDPGVRLQSGVKLGVWPLGGAKPTVRVPSGSALQLWAATGFRAQAIRFTADVPTDGGIRFFGGCRDCGIPDSEVFGFVMGVTSEGTTAARNFGIALQRAYVHDNYNPALGKDSSGLFASKTDALTLFESTFRRNGWREGVNPGYQRNHNAYVAGDCGPADVAECTFAEASSHGLQLRSGGTVRANWFIDNPIHLSVGLVNGGGPLVKGGVTATVTANTFSGTRPLAGQPRGWAVEVGNAKDVTVADNTFARDGAYDPKLGNFPAAVKVDVCDLDPANPQRGEEMGVAKLVLAGNAVTWPTWAAIRDAGRPAVWLRPEYVGKDGRPKPGITLQDQWPAADLAAVRAAAEARLAAAGR